MTDKIKTEVRGQTLLIGLNRTEKRNAIDTDMIRGISAAYTRLSDDPDLRSGVLYAEGDHFSAGLDLADVTPRMAQGDAQAVLSQFTDEGACDPLRLAGRPCEKPVVVAVHGSCYTVGIELTLAADIVVASSDAVFGQIEVSRGIFPMGGANMRMPALFGWHNAMRWLLTGDTFDATEAHRIGLVQAVVAPGKQLERALEIAERINQQAPLAVMATLENARIAQAEGQSAALAALLPAFQKIFLSEDAREGITSMIQKRPPQFKGR